MVARKVWSLDDMFSFYYVLLQYEPEWYWFLFIYLLFLSVAAVSSVAIRQGDSHQGQAGMEARTGSD